MVDRPNVQWLVDNQQEIEALLAPFCVRTDRSGDALQIVGLNGLEIELNPGDCLILDGDRLGIVRVPDDRITN